MTFSKTNAWAPTESRRHRESDCHGLVVLTCTLGGALLGMWLGTALPEHHLNAESQDTVRLGVGLIATMTALVLGLVTASARSSFDALDTSLKHGAMDMICPPIC